MSSVEECGMWGLRDGALCCAPVCAVDFPVKRETRLDGDWIAQLVVATNGVNECSKEALDGDNGVLSACCLL